MFEREELSKLLKSDLKSCCIIGTLPTHTVENLTSSELNTTNNGIQYYQLNEGNIELYMLKEADGIGFFNIENPTEEIINYVTTECYIDTLDIYQATINPTIGAKIFSISGDKLDFSDILSLIGEKQTTIAEKIGKSKQIISDIKSGKSEIKSATLSVLIKEYPLLPWRKFIAGITK